MTLLASVLGGLIWLTPACAGSTTSTPTPRDALLRKVERAGTVSVVVRLAVPFTPEGALKPRAVRAQRGAIRRAQTELLDQLEQFQVQVTARPATVPVVALVVDERALRFLLRSALVRNMQENRPERPSRLPEGG